MISIESFKLPFPSSSSCDWVKTIQASSCRALFINSTKNTAPFHIVCLYHLLFCGCPCITAAAAKLLQSCLTLCDPIDGSPPGSPVPAILQARTLEWVAISFSNAWKWKVKVKSLSSVQLFTTHGLKPTRLLAHGILQERVLEWGAIAFSACVTRTGQSKQNLCRRQVNKPVNLLKTISETCLESHLFENSRAEPKMSENVLGFEGTYSSHWH